jgi:hypothetical protein
MELLFALIFLVAIVVSALLKLPGVKGYFGERSIQRFTSRRLDGAVYHRLDNVTLGGAGGTTQIDHVFVSVYGIFVVETKNMKGWIFGGEKHAQWTQTIFKKSSRFQNPLHQNYKHVKALEALLSVPPAVINSVVVFVGESEFKTPMPRNVIRQSGLITYIKSFASPVLTKEQVAGVIERIEQARLPATQETARKHVEQLRARAVPVVGPGQPCPKCGATLVMRTSKSGAKVGSQFLGCSRFPRCRYTSAAT